MPARYRPFRSVLSQMRNETKRRKRFLHRLRFKDRTITAAEPTPTVYPQRRSGSRKAHLANTHTSNHQRLANAGLFSFVFRNYYLDVHCGTHIQAAICVLFKPSRGHSYRGRHIQANKLLVMQLTFVLSYLLVVVEERGRPPYRPLASCHPAVLRRRPCISPVDISQHSSLQDSNTTMAPSLSIR